MTTTTTPIRLVASGGVLRPRPFVRTSFPQHVAAEPIEPGQMIVLADTEDDDAARRMEMLGAALGVVLLVAFGLLAWVVV